MRCPKDGTELQRETYLGGVETDRCSECRGVWLEDRELETIQDSLDDEVFRELGLIPDTVGAAYQAARDKDEAALTCPRCDRELERREYAYCSQVMIDVCPSCRGIWLDSGELTELELFFEMARADTDSIRSGFLRGLRRMFGDR